MICGHPLVYLSATYAAWHCLPIQTILTRAQGYDDLFYEAGDYRLTFPAALQWFSDNWPAELQWPGRILRPVPADDSPYILEVADMFGIDLDTCEYDHEEAVEVREFLQEHGKVA